MATAKRTITTLRNSQRRQTLAILLFALPSLPSPAAGVASADCGATFLFPTLGLTFFYLDTIAVTYRSNIANPTLSCWCGVPGRATPKITNNNVSPFNGSVPVTLTVLSDDPCWFELRSSSGECRHTSETFHLSPKQRTVGEDDGSSPRSTASPDPALRPSPTTSHPEARAAGAVVSQQRRSSSTEDSFSIGAKAALGVGIALICIAIGAMAAFLYFRRRRRAPDAEVTGGMLSHSRRGRKGAEKKRAGASSEASGHSDEPLCPIQPVFDGFPGSMGYEDVRSLHSNTQSHSTTHSYSPQSPAYSQTGGFWTQERSIEREELTAARLKSQLQPSGPTVVSYGPNPVTPTLTPRVSPRPSVPTATTPMSSGSIEQVPGHVPMMPIPSSDYADYTNYSIPPPAPLPMSTPEPKPSPPRPQAAGPTVVSYGPNRVTPTPKIVLPTVPPDESIVNRRFQEAAAKSSAAPHHHERQFSWEADSPLLGASSMGPLPPYATTEDFEAMEKGAVRKLAEPQADAELPPTKDGFYHYTTDTVEYELPGAAPQHEPQLPFRPYEQQLQQHLQQHLQHGRGHGGPPGAREIDEQKFLLDDVELLREKARGKAKAGDASAGDSGGGSSATRRNEYGGAEEFDLGDGLGPMR
ncbi:hypothetical protein MYCTH_2062582 [Thermothelomyces thermophilus ATCC 42464]|uniref:Uncharacterized protein n=1 Tax=Thermothelomyces thermophilus (strain ATCC 42464 / BCRC 31852 / DSM 1799) TaxID=573729 RepID=G2QCH8_THET4|nr:uncharacterized protein MYCTH_2062582 [Thermothelomyces thermophilus ATCC 42464]AEO58154.1 hypothetical protein MYCTH_2062582 [Thermothelomyces thermophilus ATCC 42464]